MLASFSKGILDVAPIAIIATNRWGRVQSANAAANIMFGAPLFTSPARRLDDILIGLPVAALADSDGMDAFNARDRKGLGGILRFRRHDGSETPVDLQVARFEDGGRPFMTYYIHDVSSVMAAEAKVQDLRLQLLNNWRLNSLGEMASMVCHELNQPLSAVANSLHGVDGLLRRSPAETDRAISLVAAADGQIKRAHQILVNISKLAARGADHYDRQNVLAMLQDISPILELNGRATDAAIELDVSETDAVFGDRVQLQQLVVNLVRNALDAPQTERRRRIRIEGRRVSASTYALSVCDNGPGVPRSIVPRLFEPLNTSKPDGMGLGLSICQTIARAHDGQITHSSGPHGGATFTVTLKVDEDAIL